MFRTSIIEALRNRFAGVSDAILNRIADKLDKTVKAQEEVATAVAGVTFQQVLESYGDSRATEAQQTAVRNYESKYGLKDGVKVEGIGGQQPQTTTVTTPNPQEGADTPAWAKALIDSNKALTDRLSALEGERTTASRRQKLATVIDRLPESLRKAYERTPVESISDEEFSTLLTDITGEVEGIVKDSNARGAVFGRPSAQSGRQATQQNELSKEQLDAIGKREGTTSDTQPF